MSDLKGENEEWVSRVSTEEVGSKRSSGRLNSSVFNWKRVPQRNGRRTTIIRGISRRLSCSETIRPIKSRVGSTLVYWKWVKGRLKLPVEVKGRGRTRGERDLTFR